MNAYKVSGTGSGPRSRDGRVRTEVEVLATELSVTDSPETSGLLLLDDLLDRGIFDLECRH